MPDEPGHPAAPPPAEVAIIGAGPIGLDAALACADAGRPFTVYEAGPTVGTHVRAWEHVRMFTPWSLTLSPRMRTHLLRAGRHLPDDDATPTGADLVEHLLQPVAELPALSGRIRLGTRVAAIARTGLLKHEEISTPARAASRFRLLTEHHGERIEHADLVLDCTGTWGVPNTIGDGGIPAVGERALTGRLVRTVPRTGTPSRWAGTVLLIGAGKSAQSAARDLAALPGTRLEWLVRDENPRWGAVPDDPLPGRRQLVDSSQSLARGANERVRLHTGARVEALHPDGDRIRVAFTTHGGRVDELAADHVIGLTGYIGDASLYRQLQVHECYATAAPMNLSATLLASAGADCLTQPAAGIAVLRNPEPNFFVLGSKSYGRVNTFLLRTGYEQIDELLHAYAPHRTTQRADRG